MSLVTLLSLVTYSKMSSTTTSKASRLVRVGNYELTPGYLGKGTFAIVRLGVHKLTRTIVAVKIVEKADLDDENLHKINREIQIMRHLNHPSIIRLFQVCIYKKYFSIGCLIWIVKKVNECCDYVFGGRHFSLQIYAGNISKK